MPDELLRADPAPLPSDGHSDGLPWWQSRAIWGSLVTIGASAAGLIGWSVNVEQTTELLMLAVTLASGVLSWWGRVQATRPISRTQVLPGVSVTAEPRREP